MTPATTLGKKYYNEGPLPTEAGEAVAVKKPSLRPAWLSRLESSITWFSQNLTGQYKPQSVEEE